MSTLLRSCLLSFALLTLLGASRGFAQYNEVFDERGDLRPQYREIMHLVDRQGSVEGVVNPSAAGLGDGSTRSGGVPIVMTSEEMATLRRGVAQRARAIQAFLTDHLAGERRFARRFGILDTIEEVMKRQNVDASRFDPERIHFVLGPDILRGKDGSFVVLEDNLTAAAGVNRSHTNQKLFIAKHPEIAPHVETTATFLEQTVSDLKAKARGDRVVFLQYAVPSALGRYSPKVRNYLDNQRLWDRLAKELDFDVVRVNPLFRNGSVIQSEGVWKVIETDEKGNAFLVTKEHFYQIGRRHRIGAVFVDVLMSHLNSWAAPAVMRSFESKQVHLSHTPGIDIFDDKTMTGYIEEMVRFYLAEEPILRAPRTQLMGTLQGTNSVLNEVLLQRISAHPQDFVVKKVSGEGGEYVYIGLDLARDPKKLREVLDLVRANPTDYIAQEFVMSSQVGDFIVDFRPHALVTNGSILVSRSPFSRAVERGSSLKHNVTSNVGRSVLPVVFSARAQTCGSIFGL